MVSPVLHVLPLTIRSAYFPMIALLLRAFRDLCSLPRCWKPIVHQVFSQGMVGKKFFALRRAEQFFSNRLRRAWARDFTGSDCAERLFRRRQAVGGASEQQQQQRR